MSKPLMAASVLIGSLVFGCAGSRESAEAMTNRQRIDDRVSLAIPSDWEIWEPSDDVLFVAAAPEIGRDDLQPHFFVTRASTESTSSQESMVGNVVYLQNHQDGYVEHEIIQFDVNGRDIACVTYDAPASDWVFRNKQYFLVVDGWEYLITCKMLPEQAARWSNEFDRIVQSLQIVDGE